MKTKSVLIVLLMIFSSGITFSQNMIRVTGVVTTFKTIPLRNVTVLSSKTGDTATTDSAGVFSVQCLKKDVLRVSASGFINRKQKIKGESVYKIDLVYRDDPANFNDAVNSGHIAESTLREALSSGLVKNVKDYSNYKSVFEAISGEIYNVRVNGTMIVNTKLRSFDRTPEVLLVVDDKIVSDISFISTEYIQSIEFIDDVGTAMYGAMGANGVLKIKLK